jgi:hypothetical protein
MLVLAMQFSRSSGHKRRCRRETRTPAPATGWPRRRCLEGKGARSLKTEERTLCLEQARGSGGETCDRHRYLNQTERGSNWESFLLSQEH